MYFVGETIGINTNDEDGKRQGNFILSGYTTKKYSDLLHYDNILYRHFRTGQRIYENGESCVLVYSMSQRIEVAKENINKIEIRFDY